MRIISKIRSLPSLRRSFVMNASVPVRIDKRYPILNPSGAGAAKNNRRLLLQRFYGNSSATHDALYFSSLSTENFEPTQSLYMPCFIKKSGVSASCHGWLHIDSSHKDKESLLWNPSTNHVHVLPPCLDCEDLSYRMSSGFGFDSKSQDYKVIKFIHNYIEDEQGYFLDGYEQIVLYSLNSNSWRTIEGLPSEYIIHPQPSTYVNGCYYWEANVKGLYVIVSFDFASEDFSFHILPQNGMKFASRHDCKLVEFEGWLGLIAYPVLGTHKCFELWVYENNESWVLKWTVCVPGAELPLGLWGNNAHLLFLEGINRELMVYDLATKELKKLGIYDYPARMQLIPYDENVVLLNGKSPS